MTWTILTMIEHKINLLKPTGFGKNISVNICECINFITRLLEVVV